MADATQPTAVNRSNAEHYRWGVDCDAWYLMKDPQFTVIEELMPPGSAETRHHPTKARRFFFILSGEGQMESHVAVTLAPAGSGIRTLPGMKHQIRKPSPEAVRLLVVSHPPSR